MKPALFLVRIEQRAIASFDYFDYWSGLVCGTTAVFCDLINKSAAYRRLFKGLCITMT